MHIINLFLKKKKQVATCSSLPPTATKSGAGRLKVSQPRSNAACWGRGMLRGSARPPGGRRARAQTLLTVLLLRRRLSFTSTTSTSEKHSTMLCTDRATTNPTLNTTNHYRLVDRNTALRAKNSPTTTSQNSSKTSLYLFSLDLKKRLCVSSSCHSCCSGGEDERCVGC
jgi:hypothetical protein